MKNFAVEAMLKHPRSLVGLFFVFSILMTSCTTAVNPAGDPTKRLSDYISRSFAVRGAADRDILAEFLTGEAKQRLVAWSEEQFLMAFVDSKRQFLKLAIAEQKAISENETNVTYELSYIDQTRGRDAKVTNKKLCRMVLENGSWMIAEVRNLKELVEFRNEMSLP